MTAPALMGIGLRAAGSNLKAAYCPILAILVLLIALLYGLNVVGNLRLNTDVITLLSSALSSSQGNARIFHGEPTLYPPGYPFIVELQLKAGIASSHTLILFSWTMLLLGIATFVLLLRISFDFSCSVSLLFAAFVMLNWIFVKHAPLAMTDIPYFGIALLSLYAIERARTTKGDVAAVSIFFLGWLLALACIGIRRNGIVLLPVWIAALAARPGWFRRLTVASKSMQLMIALALLVATGASLAWILGTATLADYPRTLAASDVVSNVIRALPLRAIEAGEAILNLPRAKLPPSMGIVFLIVGAIVIVLAFMGLVRRRRLGVVEIYCLSYAAILLAWPYSDSRFLIPIIPFLLVYAFIGTGSLAIGQWRARLLLAWAVWYTLAGLAALFYSARITFAGNEFPVLYGDGTLRPTYCEFLKACPVATPGDVDSDALKLLETFQGR